MRVTTRVQQPDPEAPPKREDKVKKPPPPTEAWRRYNTRWKPGERTLRLWHRGDDVKWLQTRVGVVPDGRFGPDTTAAVLRYQRAASQILKLDVTGDVDKRTWGALRGGNFVNLTALADGLLRQVRTPGMIEIQCRLAARNCYSGAVDGVPGGLTQRGVAVARGWLVADDVLDPYATDRDFLEALGFRVTE